MSRASNVSRVSRASRDYSDHSMRVQQKGVGGDFSDNGSVAGSQRGGKKKQFYVSSFMVEKIIDNIKTSNKLV